MSTTVRSAAIGILALVLGACGSPSPMCQPAGAGCVNSSICCGGLVCANGSCTAASSCAGAGHACSATADCCSGLKCSSGRCSSGSSTACNPPKTCAAGTYQSCSDGTKTYYKASDGTVFTCATATNCSAAAQSLAMWCSAGTACGVAGDACSSAVPCCSGLKCLASTCTAPSSCAGSAAACATNSDCCAGYDCERYTLSCMSAANLDMGEPCDADSECKSGSCDGWCTTYCSSDADCTNSTSCIATSTGGSECFPSCSDGLTNCSVYGAAVTCQAATSLSGTSTRICSQ